MLTLHQMRWLLDGIDLNAMQGHRHAVSVRSTKSSARPGEQREQRKLTPAGFHALRHTLRQAHSRETLAAIEQLLLANLHTTVPQSLLGKALNYLAGQWPKLTHYVDDGSYSIDNNPAKKDIRHFVVGRRNWLFADAVNWAEASAILYSPIETAKANGLEPCHYLRHVMKELPKANTVKALEALLPWNLSPATLARSVSGG